MRPQNEICAAERDETMISEVHGNTAPEGVAATSKVGEVLASVSAQVTPIGVVGTLMLGELAVKAKGQPGACRGANK